jgi:signal recognition particle subunit SRP54
MFDSLGDSLNKVFDKLRRSGRLTESDVDNAMREIRMALLAADVALPVAKDFIAKVKEDIIGAEIIKNVSPTNMIVKLVNDHLISLLGTEFADISLNTTPPAVIMMVGLQGSGKTTSCAKLALRLTSKRNKKVMMASLDVARPAAQQQLATLGKQINVSTLPIIQGQKPLEICERAIKSARLEGYDVLILDTAGRLHIDQALMEELEAIKGISNPIETLLVVDSMTGQDAINVAKHFHERLQITGNILTRIDGDSRGGAALSIKAITGCPIKYLGVGEKLSEFEEFQAERIASRILGMGDIVSLVEKAIETSDLEQSEKMAKKLQKGEFDFDDLASQLRTIKKMGGIGNILGMLPGIRQIKNQMGELNVDEKIIGRQEAIIYSMTKAERRDVKLLNASRKKRIAAGAGVEVQDVNKLIKQYLEMQTMFKKIGKMDKKMLMKGKFGGIFS